MIPKIPESTPGKSPRSRPSSRPQLTCVARLVAPGHHGCGVSVSFLHFAATMSLVQTVTPVVRPAVSLIRARLHSSPASLHTAHSSLPSVAYTDPTRSGESSTSSTPEYLTLEQRQALDVALRVDQAGEVAANFIYKGQYAVLSRDAKLGPLVQVRSPHSYLVGNVNGTDGPHHQRSCALWYTSGFNSSIHYFCCCG